MAAIRNLRGESGGGTGLQFTGKGGDLTVLGELELHGTRDLLGSLELGGGADAGHGETDGDGGALALVEEL